MHQDSSELDLDSSLITQDLHGWKKLASLPLWVAAIYELFNLDSPLTSWDFRPQKFFQNQNLNQHMVCGTWRYSGRWSDYALDFPTNSDDVEDDPDEVDVEERVIAHFNDIIRHQFMEYEYLVLNTYIDDGTFEITFRDVISES